jgi:hypothetical protein
MWPMVLPPVHESSRLAGPMMDLRDGDPQGIIEW